MTKPSDRKRRDLKPLIEAHFLAAKTSGEDYDDLALARSFVAKHREKVGPWLEDLGVERLRDWFGELAREAQEELSEALPGLGDRRVPGVILHADGGGKHRRGLRGATLSQLRSYCGILTVNATGAVRSRDTVAAMIERCEALGCGEDDDVWPYLSDTPRLPLGTQAPSPEARPEA